jgi:hypothetical protein
MSTRNLIGLALADISRQRTAEAGPGVLGGAGDSPANPRVLEISYETEPRAAAHAEPPTHTTKSTSAAPACGLSGDKGRFTPVSAPSEASGTIT